MKIEILPHENLKGVLHLSVEENFFREIHTSIFGKRPKFSFYEGDLFEQFSEKEFERANYFVLKRLSQRSYASYELRSQLNERLVSAKSIDRVIEKCCHLGYLDDQAWLRSYIRSQQHRKVGPRMIAVKLYRKGIPQSFYEPFLEKEASKESQEEGIEKLLKTRFRSKDLSDFREKQKILAALIRKGYDFEIVNQMLNR